MCAFQRSTVAEVNGTPTRDALKRSTAAEVNGTPTGTGTAPLALVGIQETDDPCHWERVSQPWEVLAMPLTAEPFFNRKTFLATPNCILYLESFASRVRMRVLSPAGMLALSVPVRLGRRTSYFNRSLQPGGLPAMLPGSAEALYDADQQHFMLLIRLTLLRHLLPEEQAATLEAAAAGRWLPASPTVIEGLGRWLKEVLARTHGAPEMLRHPAAVETLERELVQGLVDALRLTTGSAPPERGSLRQRGFDRATECIRYADLTTLDLAALCAAAGVSQRTLEYVFREHLDLSPAAFIRQLRLHALRCELLASRLGEANVTDVA